MAILKSKKQKTQEEKKTVSAENQSKKQKSSFRKIKAYEVIKSPHITEKSTDLSQKNKYVFRVYPKTNKIEIKRAIEAFYGVTIEAVNIVHSPPKKMRLGRQEGWKHGLKKGSKKAIVTLKEGDKIEIIPGS